MVAARLKTELWVRACIFRANREGISMVLRHKGDPTSGAVLVRINLRDGGSVVLAETRDAEGNRAWFRGSGPEPVSEETADGYVERSRRRDPDLWVLEIDDRDSRVPFDERILKI